MWWNWSSYNWLSREYYQRGLAFTASNSLKVIWQKENLFKSKTDELIYLFSLGGIIPPLARDLHVENIDSVVQSALAKACVDVSQLDAIAATVKPGLPLSLVVGTNYAKALCKKWNKKFIPIHHMEAHALTARMTEKVNLFYIFYSFWMSIKYTFSLKVDFPFLVLLVSGGHCLLAVAYNVEEFHLLGESIDLAPGDALDKVNSRSLNNLDHIFFSPFQHCNIWVFMIGNFTGSQKAEIKKYTRIFFNFWWQSSWIIGQKRKYKCIWLQDSFIFVQGLLF